MLRKSNSLADQVFAALAERAEENPYLRQVVRTSIPSADCVRVHLNGKEINEAARELIADAEQEILIQFYNFYHDSDAGQDIKYGLMRLNDKAAESGRTVDVKIMVNFRRGPAAFFTRTTDNPFTWIKKDEQGTYIESESAKFYVPNLNIQTLLHEHYLFDSFHTKQIVIDRRTLMLRGCDPIHTLNYRDGKKRSTELATTIEAQDLAQAAAKSFDANWHQRKTISKIASYAENKNGIPVILFEKECSTDPIKRYGLQSPLKIAIIECIKHAVHSVKIITPNINDTDILDAILAAALRGVTVTLLTGEHANDKRESMPGMGGTNMNSVNYIYNKLPISKWDHFQVYWSHERGMSEATTKETMLHTKLMIIDDSIVITGSTPLDKQGTYYSAESDVMIESEEVAKRFLDKVFNPLICEGHSNNSFQLKVFQYSLKDDIRQAFMAFMRDDNCLSDLEHILGCIKNTSDFLSLCMTMQTLIQQPQGKPDTVSSSGLFGNRQHIQTLRRICEEHYIDCDKPENQSFGKN